MINRPLEGLFVVDVGAAGTQLRKICEEDRLLDVTASYSNSPSSADPEPRQTAPDGCDSGQVNTDSLDDQSQSRCMLETATGKESLVEIILFFCYLERPKTSKTASVLNWIETRLKKNAI